MKKSLVQLALNPFHHCTSETTMFSPEKIESDFFPRSIYLTEFEAMCIDRKSSSLLFSYGGRKNYGGVCSAETELKRNCNNNTNLVVNVKSDQKEGRREDETKGKLRTISASIKLYFSGS